MDIIKRSSFYKHFGVYAFLIVLTAFVLFPMLVALSQSFMTNQEVNRWPPQNYPHGTQPG